MTSDETIDFTKVDTKGYDTSKPQNILTIFSDTSWCPTTKAAGYGIWMRDEKPGASYGGEYSEPIHSSNMGEFLAALEAVIIAKEKKLLQRVTYVVFVLDNQRAVDLINGQDAPIVEWERKALAALQKILREHKLDYKANKVKAHIGTGTPRNWVNDKCDSLAKMHMRRQRERLKKGQNKQS